MISSYNSGSGATRKLFRNTNYKTTDDYINSLSSAQVYYILYNKHNSETRDYLKQVVDAIKKHYAEAYKEE